MPSPTGSPHHGAPTCAPTVLHAPRGPYVWRWTAIKEAAAKLVARGISGRGIARALPVHRRSVARWLQRREFTERVDWHLAVGVIGAETRRRFREAAEACDRAASTALRATNEITQGSAAATVKVVERYRTRADQERAAAAAMTVRSARLYIPSCKISSPGGVRSPSSRQS